MTSWEEEEDYSDEREEAEEIDNNIERPDLYIQMEFCEKGTLRKAIDAGEFVKDRFRMWKLFREMVEGISYLHSRNVIHRDLNVKKTTFYMCMLV